MQSYINYSYYKSNIFFLYFKKIFFNLIINDYYIIIYKILDSLLPNDILSFIKNDKYIIIFYDIITY